MGNLPKILYWVSTGLMCLTFLFSAFNYIFNYDMMAGFYEGFGFPTWLIYPMAVAKILGVVAILTRFSSLLKEWAYAGFFFDAVLGLAAHRIADDGAWMMAAAAIVFVVVSRYYESRLMR